MPVLIALAAATLSYAPSCIAYAQRPGAAGRAADAHRIAAAVKMPTPVDSVRQVLVAPGWRLVWAQPSGQEPGVFVFRRAGATLTYLDVWGGVTTDRGETTRWARDRKHMPPGLADCFADQLMLNGP